MLRKSTALISLCVLLLTMAFAGGILEILSGAAELKLAYDAEIYVLSLGICALD